MKRRLIVTAALLTGLACGCSTGKLTVLAPAVAPDVRPAQAGAYVPTATSSTAAEGSCDGVPVEASLPPLPSLPAPDALPFGSYEAMIKRRGYLLAGVDQNTYRFGYRDPSTGQLSGFDIDMLRQVSLAIFGNPDQIHYVVVPIADRVAKVQDGEVDIVAETMTITCARKQLVDFSSVYYEAGQRILVTNGSPIRTAADLAGRTVCAPAGSTSIANLAALPLTPKPYLVQVINQSDCLVMLQQGQVQAVSTDDTILDGFAAQDPNTHLTGPAFTKEPYGMAISRSHPDFVAFVNAVLAQERTDGTWKSLYAKWLGAFSLGVVPDPPAATYAAST